MKKNMKEMYNNLAKEHGDDIKTLHLPTIERQHLSFKAIADSADLNGRSILDIGCGFGDFYFFLKDKGINVEYAGIDISENIIELGKNRHPEIASNLFVSDIQEHDVTKKYDYIVICGTFNLKIENNWEFIFTTLSRCFQICKKGIIFTLISTYVDYQEGHLYYADPCEIFKKCKTFTKWVNIKYDYNPYEFVTVMLKEMKE